MTTPYSTIMNNVNVVLVDSSTITPTNPYIVYISSVSVPGRVATVRDATGYLSTPNRIIVSTLKDVLISPNISTFTITQPFGYISLSSRDINTWNIINTFAFPDPQGTANVSSLHVNDGMTATNLLATIYISTPYVNTYSISSFNLVASNAISTGFLQADLISTNTLRSYGAIKSDRLRVSTISSTYIYNNYMSTGSISSGSIASDIISTGIFFGTSLSTVNIAANIVAANSISTGLLTAPSISSASIAASLISSGLFIGTSVSTLALATSALVANSISTGVLIVPSISSVNIAASLISSGLFIGPSVSTLALATSVVAANSISTGVLIVPSISSVNIAASLISSGLFIGPSISSINIAASVVAANSISTGSLYVNSISSANIAASNISTSGFLGNSIITNTLLANTISSVSEKTSSLTTSSITLQSGTGIGYITASSDGTNILYNAKPIGTFISTATGDLFMSTYTLRTSSIVTSSISLRTGSNTGVLSISANGSNLLLNSATLANSWVPNATSALNMATFAINNVGGVTSRNGYTMLEFVYGTSAYISYTNPNLITPTIVTSCSLSVNSNNLVNVSTMSLRGAGTSNGVLQLTADAQTLKLNGSNVGGWIGTATTPLNMNGYSISNVSTVVIKSGVGNGTLQTSSDGLTLYFNSNAIGGGGAGWVSTAASDLNMNNFNILNAKTLSTVSLSTNAIKAGILNTTSISSISISTNTLQTGILNATSISSIAISTNTLQTGILNATSISSIAISTNTLNTSSIVFQSGVTAGLLALTSDGQTLKLNGSNVGGWTPTAASDLNMCNYSISSINTLYGNATNPIGVGASLDMQRNDINGIVNLNPAAGEYVNVVGTLSMNGNPILYVTNLTNVDSGSIITIGSILDLQSNIISNVNTMYINTGGTQGALTVTSDGQTLQLNGSNIVRASSGIQTFTSAISESNMNTTKAESNYLYFQPTEKIWKISVTMYGLLNNTTNNFQCYFTLSNPYLKIEQPLTINTVNRPFNIIPFTNDQTISLTFNDTVNMGPLLEYNSNFAPITLNMYASQTGGGFSNIQPNIWNGATDIVSFTTVYGIAYGNNTWMAVGYDNANGLNKIGTSYDNGNTWTGTTFYAESNTLQTAIAYGNNTWVIANQGGIYPHPIYYSTDSVNFIPSTYNDFSDACAVAYGNGVFVVVSSSSNCVAYSTDGSNWNTQTLDLAYPPLTGIAYADGLFTVVGGSRHGTSIFTSQDGSNWVGISANLASCTCVAYSAGRWMTTDGAGTLYYSDDSWATVSLFVAPSNIVSMAAGDKLVGVGSDGSINWSPNNGETWYTDSVTFSNFNSVAYGNGVFVAGGMSNSAPWSNCIITCIATNIITYSLEPVAKQPQTYVLPAPEIDWLYTYYTGCNLYVQISWFPVTDATSYKVFGFSANGPSYGQEYISVYAKNADLSRPRSLNGPMFTFDSGPLSPVPCSYNATLNTGYKNYFYVFAYKNGIRSSFPTTYVIDFNQASVELWPVIQYEYHGGSNYSSFTDVTWRNLYTNQSLNVSSNDLLADVYTIHAPNISQIGADVAIFP